VIAENDPAEQEKSVKWNSLLCNLIVFHTAIDMMEVIRQLVAEGWQVTAEDLAQLSPYLPTPDPVRRRALQAVGAGAVPADARGRAA
jgi:Tn3 transposase DDE domain